MRPSGKTPEDKMVMAGWEPSASPHGVPLEIVLGFFHDKDYVVDWLDYIQTALLDGHNPRTIRARIESATADIYGGEYSKAVMERSDRVLAILL